MNRLKARCWGLVLLVGLAACQSPENDPSPMAGSHLERAQSLADQEQYEQALAVLTPLPLKVRHMQDRQELALAGTLLLHLDNSLGAEALLRKALKGLDLEMSTETWCAPAMANLAKSYMVNDRLRQAMQAYRLASVSFSQSNRFEASAACLKLARALETELRNN